MSRRDLVPLALVAAASTSALAFADPPTHMRIVTTPSASASLSSSPRFGDLGTLPDPPATATRRKWRYEIIYWEGAIYVPTPVLAEYPKAIETPRRMGRFALELWVGNELLERVRFDVPLLAADPWAGDKRPGNAPPSFEKKAHAKTTVEVPDLERVTQAVVVDRATRKRVQVPWIGSVAPVPTSSVGAASSASTSPSR